MLPLPLPLSIVVGVRNHPEIFTLLDSVDADVEVIAILNHAPEAIQTAARDYEPRGFRLRWLELPDSRLGAIKNRGIAAATHDLVFLLDADCVLTPGVLDRIVQRSRDTDLGKVNMVIRHGSYGQRVRAANRIPANASSAYTPGLFLHRRVIDRIGGYFYHNILPWREDYELTQRLRQHGVPVAYFADLVVYHPPYSLWRDLRTAFRCGRGQRIGCESGVIQPSVKWGGGGTRLAALLAEPGRWRRLTTGQFRTDREMHGIGAALYKLVWKFVFTLGYYFSRSHVS